MGNPGKKDSYSKRAAYGLQALHEIFSMVAFRSFPNMQANPPYEFPRRRKLEIVINSRDDLKLGFRENVLEYQGVSNIGE